MTVPNSGYMMENGSIELPCTPEREKQIIAEITDKAESNPQEGDLYYVISNRWLSGWQNYVGQHIGADRPGPIDNTNIISNCEGDDDLQLLRTLEEQIDYVLVPQGVWEKLFEWYRGGPVLPRKMIAVGVQETLVVEVYPLCLKLVDASDGNQSTTIIRLSKKVSLHQLYEKVCGIKGIEPQKVRIWDYFNDSKQTLLVDSYQTLEESNLQMDQPILLEMQSDGFSGMDSTGNQLALEPLRSSLTIAGGPTLSNGNATDYSSILHRRSTLRSASREDNFDILKPVSNRGGRGLAGLQNLGNTCFMNSALQCLVHTLPLVEYFLQDYSNEINKKNPLGMRGELAIAFGELLRELWSSAPGTPVAPRAFKGKLGRFAPQFSGYNQHDSQELLAFLLDGLHEDLNCVKQKPYFEAKDFDGCPDKEAADEYWRHHKARNDSIIVDVCQGQYKSTLVCPVCSKISVTFDPFMYLSLPLPSTATRAMTVTVFYGDGSGLPIPYTVTVLKQGACKDLSLALASACCLNDDECLLLAEVYNHAIHRFLDVPLEPLSSIEDHEHIVAYRIPKKSTRTTRLEIRHRYLKGGEMKLFLTPLVTYLADIQSGADIDLAVNRLLSPLRRKPHLSKDVDSSFQLCITGERVFRCRPIAKDTPIKPDRVVKVLLDWTKKDYELYDGSYLKDLPEVGPTVKKTRQEAISLFSCLDAFLNEEPLGADDMWYCPRCKEHRQATKKLDLWRLPEILVVHLKRFSYSRYLKKKLDTFVNFPIQNLDLSKYVKCEDGSGPGQSHVYELYAISNHFGGLGGGHYTAYAKLIDDKRWYNFNDSSVSPVAEADIRTSAAYVLFYQRVKANGIIGEPSQGHGVS